MENWIMFIIGIVIFVLIWRFLWHGLFRLLGVGILLFLGLSLWHGYENSKSGYSQQNRIVSSVKIPTSLSSSKINANGQQLANQLQQSIQQFQKNHNQVDFQQKIQTIQQQARQILNKQNVSKAEQDTLNFIVHATNNLKKAVSPQEAQRLIQQATNSSQQGQRSYSANTL